MFLVQHSRAGATDLVFIWQDPRKDGFTGTVVEGVSLDYDMERVHSWPDGHDCPEAVPGCNPADPTQYKVFKYTHDRTEAGFNPVAGMVRVFGRWSDYAQLLNS